jgi:hypothetical protein
MRYATWNVVFSNDSKEGTVPLAALGAFHVQQVVIAGYIPANFDIEQHSLWAVEEITASQFLDLALQVSPSASMSLDGSVMFEMPAQN